MAPRASGDTSGVLGFCAALLVALFLCAVALPLATYTTTIALFGLAHVGSELRYIDYRFGPRLRGGLGVWLIAPLAIAVAARVASIAGWLAPTVTVTAELGAGALMMVAFVACMSRHRLVGAAVSAALVVGAVLAPFTTLLCLAIGHNFTPLAFLADALPRGVRRRAMLLLLIPFVALPLLIATGLPYRALAAAGLVAPDATLFAGGSLDDNVGAYVPIRFLDAPWALHAFSAAVFAQCMHYVSVILILPRLIDDADVPARAIAPWPRAGRFALYLAAATLALAVAFTVDFAAARKIYALAALVHSWLELPILLLALDRPAMAAVTPDRARIA
jgi:hypothetical protein